MNMMEQYFAGMSAEDKQKMMAEMMPKMMSSMMNMMGGSEGKEGCAAMDMTAMPKMMMEMMPRCLSMALPGMPKKERIDFVVKMVSILIEKGCEGLSEEEKKFFLDKVTEKARV